MDELEAMKSHIELAAGHLLQALKCAAKLAESQPTAPNTGSPKSAHDIVESTHPCEYCQFGADEDPAMCDACSQFGCFSGRRLRASA